MCVVFTVLARLLAGRETHPAPGGGVLEGLVPVVGSSQQEGGLVSPAVTSRSIGLCFALESRIPGTLDSLMPFQSCPNGGKPKCPH